MLLYAWKSRPRVRYTLAVLEKLGKATVSFVISVRPFSSLHRTTPLPLDGVIWHFIFEGFLNISRKLTRITGNLHEDLRIFWQYLAELFLELEIFQAKVVEKLKTHILCSITYFENRAIYEIIRKNMVAPDTPYTTMQYGTCALHAGKQGLQTHDRDM